MLLWKCNGVITFLLIEQKESGILCLAPFIVMNMQINKPQIFFFSLLLILGCRETPVSFHSTITPEVYATVENIDLPLSGNFFHFSTTALGYLIYDAGLDKIVTLSKDFLSANIFGVRGDGPGEFKNAPMLYSLGNNVIAVEPKQVIQYDSSGHIDKIVSVNLPSRGKFFTESFDPIHDMFLISNASGNIQLSGFNKLYQPILGWGKRVNIRSNGIPIPLPNGDLVRVGMNDGLVYRIKENVKIDSLDLMMSSTYLGEAEFIDRILDGECDNMCLPIAQQVKVHGDYLFIRIGTQPTDGRPTGFGANDVRKWLVLRWNPQLELVAEWEVPVELGRLYTGFVIGPDGQSLIAYEAERGEFHRLPFPEGFGEW